LIFIDLFYFIHLFIFTNFIFSVLKDFVGVSFFIIFIIEVQVYDYIILILCLFFDIYINNLIVILFVFLLKFQEFIFVLLPHWYYFQFMWFVIYLIKFSFLLFITNILSFFSILLLSLSLQLIFNTFKLDL
jgi:hypothetical protein